MNDREPCRACGGQPEAIRIGAYWQFRCPHHVGRFSTIAGHTMKTKGAASTAWDREMPATTPKARHEQR